MNDDVERRRTSALLGGGTGVVLFGLIALVVHADPHWLRSLDHGLGSGPQRFTADHRWVLNLANFVADVTQPDYLVGLVLVIAGLLALVGHWRAGVWALIVIEASRWGYYLLKAVFERPRPHWAHPAAHAGGWSFPSGHSTAIAALAGIAIVLAIMFSPTRRLRYRVISGALVVAALVGFDRILLGVHYPSDVLGGLLLGASITLLTLAAFDPLPHRDRPHRTTIAP
ncbi:phosphatase PAP2 family protein [Nocardioides marmorisolisilvae]|uniref:phosphatase PAP2 family protein n=1 Tax=Nocardioides marmorisolisilvae TaxID=1542737 RepID=UPI00160DC93A|nr:phosphatase PAP2 family protein [Nocardioides marmorisolisilvae]